jgi:thioredoxin reductase (NADPH)
MPDPILFTIDDEPEVLRAVERDLRRQYGADFRVIRAESGEAALAALPELKRRNETVALFLVDQRMPGMGGIEFLTKAVEFFPRAKRVLLTAYADTEVAIQAINSTKIDYYLMKPWDPPEVRLYPVLSDLLDDWLADYRPPFDGIRVLGHRWSSAAYGIKDFLARNQVPYQWLDVEASEAAQQLLTQIGAAEEPLPLVLFLDGTRLAAPSIRDLAERVGLRTRAEAPFYDLLIAGAGPAGLAAGVYAASEGLRTVIVELQAPGGQAGTSNRIENYLGFPSGISGAELARRAATQARRFGTEILTPAEVVGLRVQDPYRYAVLADGAEVGCRAMLVATGVSYRRLNVPGIDPLVGLGVYYGATVVEAMAHGGQDVFIVGGANSAGQAAVAAARYARSVTMLVRGETLADTMSRYLIDQIEATPTVAVRLRTSVQAVSGDPTLETITLADAATGNTETVPAGALFIFIGAEPRTGWLDGVVARDAYGFVYSGPDVLSLPRKGRRARKNGASGEGGLPPWPLERPPFYLETNVPGIFVAGDVRHGATRRVATGVGEGAGAIPFIHQYLATV